VHPRHFLTALGFLTRLWPARIIPEAAFPASVPWFPLAGLAVGAACVVPALLGLFAGAHWLQGWLAVAISLYVTRGLHADGLADMADAWGSCAAGERFWEILKDSRVGPFGVLGLVMALSGQIAAFTHLFALGKPWTVAWCFMAGRFACVALLFSAKRLARPGLLSLFAAGATPGALAFGFSATTAAGLFLATPAAVVAGLAASCLPAWLLLRLARRLQGVNGDFLGACVVSGELAAALAASMF
jgi:adenosylcobinamide-GDP ribazoletransferase